jgi:hypothetical protein
MAHALAVDTLNSMDINQRRKLCNYYIGLSTAEMCMQLADASNNYAATDLYVNTLCYQDQAILSETVELLELSLDDLL